MLGVRWLLGVMLLLASSVAWSALKEGELNPDLTNPGSVEFPSWFKNTFLDIGEDVAEAAAAHKRVLLFFYQDGCPYCKKLVEFNFTQHDIVTQMKKDIDVIALNMWGDREVTWVDGTVMSEKAFAVKMRVMFTPTLLFLDEKGKVALRVNGYYGPRKFKAALDYVATHQEGKERFAAYYNRIKPAPAAGKLHTENYILDTAKLSAPATSSSGYKLVLFEQKDCPNCDELHQDVFKRKETLEQLRRFNIYQLDMWSRQPIVTPAGEKTTAREWAKQLDIKYAPSMVFFDGAGKEVFRAEAYLKSFHVQSVLDYIASGAYRKEPEFQRYIEGRGDRLRAKGVEIKLMQ
jgi:thioredoxin-related protein